MCSARFIRSLFRCLWMPLVVCCAFCAFRTVATVFASGLPPCVLHVLRVLQIPRDRLWTWIQDDETTGSSGEEDESSDEEEEAAEEEQEEEDKEGSDAGIAIKEEENEPSLAQRPPGALTWR